MTDKPDTETDVAVALVRGFVALAGTITDERLEQLDGVRFHAADGSRTDLTAAEAIAWHLAALTRRLKRTSGTNLDRLARDLGADTGATVRRVVRDPQGRIDRIIDEPLAV